MKQVLERNGSERVPAESLADDPIRLYMREVTQIPLLTPEQEAMLAKRVQKGDEAARELMIKANLRLVVKIARDYENYGLPLLDLISEGNIGLIKGVERFDPSKGAKLSTYAAWWIKQAIKRALAEQGKTIRLPVHVVDKLFHIRKTESLLTEILGREPSDHEIADEIGLKPNQVRNYRKAAIAPSSLEATLGADDVTIADLIADPNIKTPWQYAAENCDSEALKKMLATLDAREQTILALRFGLSDDVQKTLEEVGAKFGVTRERVRQIQNAALRKLRIRMARILEVRELDPWPA